MRARGDGRPPEAAVGMPAEAARLPGRTWPEVSFEDRMATVEFRAGTRPHITVDSRVCRSCTTQDCVTVCPAGLFTPVSGGGILFNYEQCFECGACYQACNGAGAISWSYPDGGDGVVFRHG